MKNIREKIKNIPKRIYRAFESKRYREGKYSKYLNILNGYDTVDFLQKTQNSFCRFGDGEIAIMRGESIPFQKYDEKLSEKMMHILGVNEPKLSIGINYFYLNPVDKVNQFTRNFLNAMAQQRKFLIKHCNRDMVYIDAAITQVYQNYYHYDFELHFKRMQLLFTDKDITVVCGKSAIDNIEHNALSVSRTLEYIYAPEKNAYSQYDQILERAVKIDKNRIICVILGPTAKVLVYDLYKMGYTAWDIGHYLKDYDAYVTKKPKTDEEIRKFFKPD